MKNRYIFSAPLTLFLALLLMTSCGKSDNTFPKTDASAIITQTLETEPVMSAEYSTLSDSSKVAYLIMQQTEIELLREKNSTAEIRITYPDAASVIVEQTELGISPDEIYANLVSLLESRTITYAVVETEVEYTDDNHRSIVWSDDVLNAVSGGLYRLGME